MITIEEVRKQLRLAVDNKVILSYEIKEHSYRPHCPTMFDIIINDKFIGQIDDKRGVQDDYLSQVL